MSNHILKILFPPNSRRRLFIDLISRAIAQPHDFFRYVNLSSFRYFLNYLRNTDPELVAKMVDQIMARDKTQGDEAAQINHHFLEVVAGKSSGSKSVPQSTPVDIIIPVYNAPELTETCIASVLANSGNCRVLIVDDASTDPRVAQLIAALQPVPERGIELLTHRNESNLGFVRSVNHAVAMTSNHFVILNSDTEVPPGWLDRLFAPIFAGPDRIASVTPFSNAGMACSFPETDRDNPIYLGMPVAELDSLFSRYGGTEPVELFSGVGFCMAFNRRVVERIGMFDAETFGKGYGEETDWSLRAYDAGFRNVLAPNLFVYHKHGGSFGAEEKLRLLESNQDRLWKKHGRHMPRLREMAANDQPRPIRETVKLMALVEANALGQPVAIIDVDLSGGGTVYSALLAEQLVISGFGTVHFRYNARQGYLKIRVATKDEAQDIVLPAEAALHLQQLFAVLHVGRVIVNQLTTWPEPQKLMTWLAHAGYRYVVMAHDFFMVCSSWFLLNQYARFCGVPDDLAVCVDCMKSNNAAVHREFYRHALDDLASWRRHVRTFLDGGYKVVFFSCDTASWFGRGYRGLPNTMVCEHAIPNRERFVWRERLLDRNGTLNLAVIGHLFPTKGEGVIRELIDSERFRALPVRLTVFGESPLFPPGHVSADGQISFTGGYVQEELPQLLEQYGVNAILIPSIWPETFSYTTSEAILMGYPVICFNLGAQAERVRKHACGVIVNGISAAALLEGIEQLLDNPALVPELSRNCSQYVPNTHEKHFGEIMELIGKVR